MKLKAGIVSEPGNIINVLDFTQSKIETYHNYIEWDPDHGQISHREIIKVSTSSADKSMFQDISNAFKEFEDNTVSNTVPSAVIDNVWDLPKYSRNQNNLTDYIKEQLWVSSITIEAVKDKARKLGFLSGELNKYWINTANGGKVLFSIKIDGNAVIIDLIEARDSDNNTVPFNVSDIGTYQFDIPSNIRGATAAFARFGFSVKIRSGKVTIINCDSKGNCKQIPSPNQNE
ncbi:hypothetical protein [Pseudoalteromonas sp. MTN2-4]|uniref:hypothetical protein n=1 Tax=Pseudoalteromonas sp. MTN2-4 TaxID=3056555 RepID=UPI0036F355FB